jgi:hypothetical protein
MTLSRWATLPLQVSSTQNVRIIQSGQVPDIASVAKSRTPCANRDVDALHGIF